MKDLVGQLKRLNHAWFCSKKKCLCDQINLKDEVDLGNKIIQEMWEKEKRYINHKKKWRYLKTTIPGMKKL